MSRINSVSGVLVAFFLILAVAIGSIVFGIANATHVETQYACHVTDKDRSSNGNGGSDMRVYTDNCGVFNVADSLLSWTWSSADTYNEVEVGETYDFTTRGYRVPFFSMFPNVVEVEPVG